MFPAGLMRVGFGKVFDRMTGAEWRKWSRVVMSDRMGRLVAGLGPGTLDVLEISGDSWQGFAFVAIATPVFPHSMFVKVLWREPTSIL